MCYLMNLSYKSENLVEEMGAPLLTHKEYLKIYKIKSNKKFKK